MNEPAVRLEEQIISLFPALETEVYQGWILKQEEISHQKSLDCQFRIVEHTNYYVAARLEDYGYKLHHSYIVGERYINESAMPPGQNRSKETGTPKAILREEAGDSLQRIRIS